MIDSSKLKDHFISQLHKDTEKVIYEDLLMLSKSEIFEKYGEEKNGEFVFGNRLMSLICYFELLPEHTHALDK